MRTRGHGYFTPLRYPGGKGKLATYVSRVIQLNDLDGGTYVEPYAGGAAVAMELLLKDVVRRIHINDLNPAVHAFWYSVLNDTEGLVRLIRNTRVDMRSWQVARQIQTDPDASPLELGFSTFFLNRTNRSGILRGGVIGGKNQDGPWKLDARYNIPDLTWRIERIAERAGAIHLHHEDARRLVRRLAPKLAAKSLIYFDPPYFVKGKDLYMHHYLPDDHLAVSETVADLPGPSRWMVSYDDHPEIRRLYKSYQSVTYTLNYTAQERMRGSEVIFFSDDLVVPAPIKPMRVLPIPERQ